MNESNEDESGWSEKPVEKSGWDDYQEEKKEETNEFQANMIS